MPIYSFECNHCKKIIETIASMSESDVPPEESKDDACPEHKWTKVILSAPSKRYAPGWGSDRKGRYGSDW